MTVFRKVDGPVSIDADTAAIEELSDWLNSNKLVDFEDGAGRWRAVYGYGTDREIAKWFDLKGKQHVRCAMIREAVGRKLRRKALQRLALDRRGNRR